MSIALSFHFFDPDAVEDEQPPSPTLPLSLIDRTLREIVSQHDLYPTVWVVALLSELPQETVFSHLVELEARGEFPYRLVLPIVDANPIASMAMNLAVLFTLSDLPSTVKAVAETMGVSPSTVRDALYGKTP